MRILSLLFVAAFLMASGPKYGHKDPKLDDEFANVYYDIGRIPTMGYFTKAQLFTTTPRRSGILYFCTDCSTDAVVVSTAATPAGISRLTARTTAIN